MLSDELFSSVCGPPIAANTAISKDVGIYAHTLTPAWAVKSSFKKSSAPVHCLALSDSHVYAAQDQKAHVHVYSRARGNQEALVPFQERIRCLALAGDVLVLGTAEGRLILWELPQRDGMLADTQLLDLHGTANHNTSVSCAGHDSNINVWSLPRLLEPGQDIGHEPDRTLSNHRAAITDLVLGPGSNPETNTGQVLRTLLFPTSPLCISLDHCARALFVSSEDGSLYLVELFGDKPLLGSHSAELASIVMQINSPLGVADEEAGPASCMALNYDGTSIVTGHAKGKILKWNLVDNSHPTELANLNASITNLAFAPILSEKKHNQSVTVVKPNQSQRQYTLTTQLEGDLNQGTRFSQMLDTNGFSDETIAQALASFAASTSASSS
ncbi:wd domain-containing [Trichoderma arundinaceum]|uniref:Pre-rRNA-processing protein IPI3 n=1 Tax=Trichoderma arundinaceum TaxID=490622 RepID=A0A395NF28_TRIAR|nr:wd domain-containing [Trichoderma arundinaceum]